MKIVVTSVYVDDRAKALDESGEPRECEIKVRPKAGSTPGSAPGCFP